MGRHFKSIEMGAAVFQPNQRTMGEGHMVSDPTALKTPEQVIPVPTTLSPQAQTYLTQRTAQLAASGQTHVEPQELSELVDPMVNMMRPLAAGFQGSATVIALPSGAELHRAKPEGTRGRRAEVAYFDIHGGGFVVGGGEMCALTAKLEAADYGAEVFSVDYRMLPDHPYPAALDDCLEAYTEILKSYPPSALVVAGTSAGGNLAAALSLRARDEGLPLPTGLFLFTPALDLTLAGDSHQTNRFLDVNLYGGVDYIRSYAGAEVLEHPHVSPLFGNVELGWPQTLLATEHATCFCPIRCACTEPFGMQARRPNSTLSKLVLTADSWELPQKTPRSWRRLVGSPIWPGAFRPDVGASLDSRDRSNSGRMLAKWID
ncbi:alpha/beta hydrolase [Mesorhizobium onobrychidis]|uniref:alpha/beta hydrolase n=1 Tax=Mesorhizobium onobrychidis TaxID=2775404 RepID=UPI0021574DEC|nr:alpha/beta hydrolase [Mesorhizobium onobrychidis]